MQKYREFYHRVGLRKLSQLESPKLIPLPTYVLPKESYYLHVPFIDKEIGPVPSDSLLRHYPKRMVIGHLMTILPDEKEAIGSPKRDRSFIPGVMEKDYRKRYRTIRPIMNRAGTLKDVNTLMILNGGFLPKLYYYPRTVASNFYSHYNVLVSCIYGLKESMGDNTRQQFIEVPLPERLLGPKKMNRLTGVPYTELQRSLLSTIDKLETLFLLEIWKLLSPKKKANVFDLLTVQQLDRVNLVFTDAGYAITINVGVLLKLAEMKDSGGEELEDGTRLFQRRFLGMLLLLQEMHTNTEHTTQHDPLKTHKEEDDDEHQGRDIDQEEGDLMDQDLDSEPDKPVDAEIIDKTLDRLDEMDELEEKQKTKQENPEEILDNQELTQDQVIVPIETTISNDRDYVSERIDRYLKSGKLSVMQAKRLRDSLEKSRNMKNPFVDKPFDEWRQIQPEETELTAEEITMGYDTPDESMKQVTLDALETKYIDNVYKKDVANAIMGLQRFGFIPEAIEQEHVVDAFNDYQVFRIKVTPVEGSPSTIPIRIPTMQPDGTFLAGGVKYRHAYQRMDVPIRKVSSDQVALTSYTSKLFVQRSSRAVSSYSLWLIKELNLKAFVEVEGKPYLTEVVYSNVFDQTAKNLPRAYTTISKEFKSFKTIKGVTCFFHYKKRHEHFGEELVKQLENKGEYTVFAKGREKYVVVNQYGECFTTDGKTYDYFGIMEELFELPLERIPTDMVEVSLYSKTIPLVFMLSYTYGIRQILGMLDAKFRLVPRGKALTLNKYETAIKFKDYTLVVSRQQPVVSMIMSGLNRYHKEIARYSFDAFDKHEVWITILENSGLKIGIIRELEFTIDGFVDPITEDLLKRMGEPTDFNRLMVRATDLLTNDSHPDEIDTEFMRFRGQERFAGIMYAEIARAVRKYRSRGVGESSRLEMNPEAVWIATQKDASVQLVEELNPIEVKKQQEFVTYSGVGGRSGESMVKSTRRFHPNDTGVISELTADSGKVGINTYFSANPNLASVRGTLGKRKEKLNGVDIVSPSMMLSFMTDTDQPQRWGFIGIQNKHLMANKMAIPSATRTFYDDIFAYRCGDLWASHVKEACTVIDVTDTLLTLQTKDGTPIKKRLGRVYGKASDKTVPHNIITDLVKGQKVEPMTVICWNDGFFNRNLLDPKKVILKVANYIYAAFTDDLDTHEDASAISELMSKGQVYDKTKPRYIKLNFEQNISGLPKIGQVVDSQETVATLDDGLGLEDEVFSEKSRSTLEMLSKSTPKAEFSGVVEDFEVFYHGDLEDMSDSLRKLAMESNKRMAIKAKELDKPVVTGQVDGFVRIDGSEVPMDTAVIKLYITSEQKSAVGDKGVFFHQLKTVYSSTMTGVNLCEEGIPIVGRFSYTSSNNRSVTSPERVGAATTVLMGMTKQLTDLYFGE